MAIGGALGEWISKFREILMDRVETGDRHLGLESADARVSLEFDGNRVGKVDRQRLPTPDNLFRIGDGADLATRLQHAKRLPQSLRAIFDMMDNVYREHEVEGLGREVQEFGAAKQNANGGVVRGDFGQHLGRRVHAPACAADRLVQGKDVVAGAAADFEHARGPLKRAS